MEDKTQEKKQRIVYSIIEKPGRKPFWMKVGIAWLNQDQSWNVYLDAIPFDRKLNIREEDVRPRFAGNDAQAAAPTFEMGGIQ